jgi:hypothetical protein
MKTLSLILLLVWSTTGFGQGSSCSNAYDLTLDAVCRNFPVSTTSSSCDFCSYSGSTGKVTYFRFTTDNTPQCVLLDVTASSNVTMELVLYDGCNSGTASPSGGLFLHNMCMDQGKGLWAQSFFNNLAPNTSYYLRVRTQGGFTGNVQVCGKYYTPANDICSGATAIGTVPVTDNNACHTPGPTVPAAQVCATTLENTAWYTYVVQNNGNSTITIDNIECNNGDGNTNSGFQIGFFTGSCGSLTPLNCNSGSGGSVSATAVGLSAGSRIYVAVDGYSGSNCSYRIGASNAQPLPVRIKEFLGWKTTSKNILKWVTVEESDNDYFEIQRSIDGYNYTALGRIAGQEYSTSERQYLFDDPNPPARALYRLKQVDIDERITYSKVVEISRAELPILEVVALRLNYDQLNISIKSSQKEKIQLTVIDVQGRTIKASWINCDIGITNYATVLPGLSQGQYFAVLTYGREKQVRSFMRSPSMH